MTREIPDRPPAKLTGTERMIAAVIVAVLAIAALGAIGPVAEFVRGLAGG